MSSWTISTDLLLPLFLEPNGLPRFGSVPSISGSPWIRTLRTLCDLFPCGGALGIPGPLFLLLGTTFGTT